MNANLAYQTLHLERDASMEEIKTAYRRLALESHPDRKGGSKDDSQFKRVTEAYNVLKNRHGGHPAGSSTTGRGPGTRSGSQWGAPSGSGSASYSSSPPQQDWEKFTKEFEYGDPGWWKEYERKFWEEYNNTVNADGRNGEHEKARESKSQPDLCVNVDPSLCIGCCSCEIIAPEVFHIDKVSQTNPKSHVVNQRGAGINKIMNAAETCPTKAIRVENKDTNERLYPH